MGYWGGVKPDVTGMEHYESKMASPVSSPGVQSNEDCDCLKCIPSNGLGLVNPEKVFNYYDELHSYLASSGIDGLKVDAQNILETLGTGHVGRVKLARKYHQALEASIARDIKQRQAESGSKSESQAVNIKLPTSGATPVSEI